MVWEVSWESFWAGRCFFNTLDVYYDYIFDTRAGGCFFFKLLDVYYTFLILGLVGVPF